MEKKARNLSLLEKWIRLFFLFNKNSLKRPSVELHNGNNIFDYPEKKWSFVPFPHQKGDVFNADNLATVNKHDFLDEEKFKQSLILAEKRWGTPGKVRNISWRLHTILWGSGCALRNFSYKQDVIFLECGTGKGYMAAGLCHYHDFKQNFPEFYLVDTFMPFLEKDEQVTHPADFAYSDGDEEVKSYFIKYENVRILKGRVPEVLSNLPDKPIGFLHLDLNDATAESEALDFLKNKFIKGSVIIFDDFGGFGGDAQALVHRKFAEQVNRELLILPTGQALIIF